HVGQAVDQGAAAEVAVHGDGVRHVAEPEPADAAAGLDGHLLVAVAPVLKSAPLRPITRGSTDPTLRGLMNAYASVPAAYKESSILTAPPERLVVMLYDGAHRFLKQAAAAMRENDLAHSNDRLQRAEAIISQLHVTLELSA